MVGGKVTETQVNFKILEAQVNLSEPWVSEAAPRSSHNLSAADDQAVLVT